MPEYKILRTKKGEVEFDWFQQIPRKLYPKNSARFRLGHDPVAPHLEGCYVLLKDNDPVGRFAFYENPELKYDGEVAACIGSYECENNETSGKILIEYAKDLTKTKGYTWLIGPMEGSTWHNYRFSVHNDQRNFFMEPYHHIYYNDHFKQSGFNVIADYFSNRDTTLNYDQDKLTKFEQYYLDQGAVFRHLEMSDLTTDLSKIAQFSLDGFSNNFLFTPISVEAFVTKYLQLKHYFNPELVWIVENAEGEMQAFIFAIKDHMDLSGKTVIIKSMVRKKTSPFRGIGSYLAGKIIELAKQQGYEAVIHALMIRDNASMAISDNYAGEAYKSYALYGVKL